MMPTSLPFISANFISPTSRNLSRNICHVVFGGSCNNKTQRKTHPVNDASETWQKVAPLIKLQFVALKNEPLKRRLTLVKYYQNYLYVNFVYLLVRQTSSESLLKFIGH